MTTQRRLLANNIDDVMTLAACFVTTPKEQHPDLLATVYHLDLMRMRWPLKPFVWAVQKRHGKAGLLRFFRLLQRLDAKAVGVFMGHTIRHIAHGVDREDADSVGGLSQREIDALLGAVTFSALALPEHAAGAPATCKGYWPDYQAGGDCVTCGRMMEDHEEAASAA